MVQENLSDNKECIFCHSKNVITKNAFFAPFIIDRMFHHKQVATELIICPDCKIGFASYRPNDEEMGNLYRNYRDEEYQQQRQKYEPEYTNEENNRHGNNPDTSVIRKGRINKVLSKIDLDNINSILDYGGDRGQYIPDELLQKQCYVYEISDIEPIKGVVSVSDHDELLRKQYDLTICCHVLEHVSNPRQIIDELLMLTNDNGYVYIEVPRSTFGYYKTKDSFRIHEHINYYTLSTFLKLDKIYSNVQTVDIKYDTDYIGILLRKKQTKQLKKNIFNFKFIIKNYKDVLK